MIGEECKGKGAVVRRRRKYKRDTDYRTDHFCEGWGGQRVQARNAWQEQSFCAKYPSPSLLLQLFFFDNTLLSSYHFEEESITSIVSVCCIHHTLSDWVCMHVLTLSLCHSLYLYIFHYLHIINTLKQTTLNWKRRREETYKNTCEEVLDLTNSWNIKTCCAVEPTINLFPNQNILGLFNL